MSEYIHKSHKDIDMEHTDHFFDSFPIITANGAALRQRESLM